MTEVRKFGQIFCSPVRKGPWMVDRPSAYNHVFPQLGCGRAQPRAARNARQPPPVSRDQTQTAPRRYHPSRPLIAPPLRDVATPDPTPLRPACSSSVGFMLFQAKPGMSSLPLGRRVGPPRGKRPRREQGARRGPSRQSGQREPVEHRATSYAMCAPTPNDGQEAERGERDRAGLAASARGERGSGGRIGGAALRRRSPRRASSSCRIR